MEIAMGGEKNTLPTHDRTPSVHLIYLTPCESRHHSSALRRLSSSSTSFVGLLALLCCIAAAGLASIARIDGAVSAYVTTTVPDPIVGTWVTLSATAANEEDGTPSARCDHQFLSLAGRSQRSNAAVPFPGGVAPSTDDYADILWLHGGHEDSQYNDTWLLSVNGTVPTWTRVHFPSSISGTVSARWGFGADSLPNGLTSDDTGLTVLIFAGYSNDEYLGDVSSFNLNSQMQRVVMASELAESDSQPFARGYTEWKQLPLGAATGGAINTSVDSGLFYTINGLGASSGVRYSADDEDLNDEWLYNVSSNAWTRIGTTNCSATTTTCTDSTTLSDVLAEFGVLANETVDLSSSIRPAEIYDAVQTLETAIGARGLTSTTYSNDPDSCTTTCSSWETGDRVVPPAAEGSRMVVVGESLYLWGGYSCSVNGAQAQGGESCHHNIMYIMNVSTLTWRAVDPPDSDSDWYDYWPSKRAYHGMTAITERGLVIVEGGAYLDSSGTFYYYDDAYAFDVSLELFVPLTTYGVTPSLHWSAGFQAQGDELYLYGGCQGTTYYDQLLVLRIGLEVTAENCYASGSGLTSSVAGKTSSFIIQTREIVTTVDNGTTTTSFGSNATYGTGLDFAVQLVASVTPSGSISLIQGKVVELGEGAYRVTYTASGGSSFQVFISLDDDSIPNSPFTMTLSPKPVANASLSSASGWGTNLTAKGESAEIIVQIADEYGNEFTDTSFLASNETEMIFTAAIDTGDGSGLQTITIAVTNNDDGTYELTHDVPSVMPNSYSLAIYLNGESISDSPFTITALDPLTLPSSLINAFWALTFIHVALCVCSGIAVFRYRATTIMRSSSPNFLYVLLLGSIICSLSVVFLLIQDDGACQAFHSLLSIGLVMSMGSLLAKSHRVSRIFNAKQLKVQKGNTDSRLFMPLGAVVLGMVLLNLLWIGIDPMRSVEHPSSTVGEEEVLSFKACSGDNGTKWLAGVLAYCGVVLLYGVYLAVKTGHVPSQFNESKVIAATIYNIFICCAIVVPLLFFLGSSSDFIIGRAVIESLVILWCNFFTVLALMAPKLSVLSNPTTVHRDAALSGAGPLHTQVHESHSPPAGGGGSGGTRGPEYKLRASSAAMKPPHTSTPSVVGGGGGGGSGDHTDPHSRSALVSPTPASPSLVSTNAGPRLPMGRSTAATARPSRNTLTPGFNLPVPRRASNGIVRIAVSAMTSSGTPILTTATHVVDTITPTSLGTAPLCEGGVSPFGAGLLPNSTDVSSADENEKSNSNAARVSATVAPATITGPTPSVAWMPNATSEDGPT